MTWKEVGGFVAKTAPVLGGVLGGPVGAVAAAAGSLTASFLGEEPKPEAVMKAVRDPQVLLKLKELENNERDRLLSWREKQLELEAANTADARAREVALAKAGSSGALVTGLVALVVVAGFFGMLTMVLRMGEAVPEAGLLLLGSLGTAFGAVVNYYLGSSLGSTRKTDMLGKAAPMPSSREAGA